MPTRRPLSRLEFVDLTTAEQLAALPAVRGADLGRGWRLRVGEHARRHGRRGWRGDRCVRRRRDRRCRLRLPDPRTARAALALHGGRPAMAPQPARCGTQAASAAVVPRARHHPHALDVRPAAAGQRAPQPARARRRGCRLPRRLLRPSRRHQRLAAVRSGDGVVGPARRGDARPIPSSRSTCRRPRPTTSSSRTRLRLHARLTVRAELDERMRSGWQLVDVDRDGRRYLLARS